MKIRLKKQVKAYDFRRESKDYAEMAKYEKNYGKGDFRIYKYTKKDYVRSEKDQDKHCLVDLISDHDRIVVYHAVRYCDHEAERR